MDEQKRAQMPPKKDLPNKAADYQLMKQKWNSPSSSEKTDVHVQHVPPPNHMHKSPVSNIRMLSLQTPYQHPQVMDRQGWQSGSNLQQKGLFSSQLLTPMQLMHKAERKYQVGAVTNAEEAKQRQLKGILNKLTPQNFEKLLEQVKSVNIDNAVTLTGLISQIFDKALMEPTFSEMYADLCFHLSGALPDFNWYGEKITFKRLVINKCQEEFERGEDSEEGKTEEKRLKSRRRMLCNIRLIGELYKKRMLTEKIMHACIQKLLGYDQDPHEENIEALCELMSTIGVMIDHHKAKVHIDAYFERMKMLSCKQELSSRVRFMLINVMDLRKNNWQERMKVEGPIPYTVG